MGLRERLYRLLSKGSDAEPQIGSDPVDIGTVSLAMSEIYATRLRDAGFNVVAVPSARVGLGAMTAQPTARILAAASHADDARSLLDRISR